LITLDNKEFAEVFMKEFEKNLFEECEKKEFKNLRLGDNPFGSGKSIDPNCFCDHCFELFNSRQARDKHKEKLEGKLCRFCNTSKTNMVRHERICGKRTAVETLDDLDLKKNKGYLNETCCVNI
jgi:hypothetical protein